MVMQAIDHALQLRRIEREIGSIVDATDAIAPTGVLSKILFTLGLVALGFGLYHLAHGDTALAIIAFAVEVAILVLHAVTQHYERRIHVNHQGRVQNLRDELLEKEEMLIGTADANEIRLRGWFRRYRRW